MSTLGCLALSELLDFSKSPTLRDALNTANKTIRIYIPIATSYGFIFRHNHFRTLDLYVEDDPKSPNGFKIIQATLIDSRNSFFGFFWPTRNIKASIVKAFPNCNFKTIFTGHQSVILEDNDSCGYRPISYIFQLANRSNRSDFLNTLQYQLGFIGWLKKIWNGIFPSPVIQPAVAPTPSMNRSSLNILPTKKHESVDKEEKNVDRDEEAEKLKLY